MVSRSYAGRARVVGAPISRQVMSGKNKLFNPCPKCGAKPGWKCVSLRSIGTDDDGIPYPPVPMKNFHPERKGRPYARREVHSDADAEIAASPGPSIEDELRDKDFYCQPRDSAIFTDDQVDGR